MSNYNTNEKIIIDNSKNENNYLTNNSSITTSKKSIRTFSHSKDSNSKINKKFNEISSMSKNNKEYEEKIQQLRNRINKLRKDELKMNKKLKNMENKEKEEEKIKVKKIEHKKILDLIKKENEKNLELKKLQVQYLKKDTENCLKKSKNNYYENKKINYLNSLNEKILLKNIKDQFNSTISNKNKFIYTKIKQEQNEFETLKFRKKLLIENKKEKNYDKKLNSLKNYNNKIKNKINFNSKYLLNHSR